MVATVISKNTMEIEQPAQFGGLAEKISLGGENEI